MKKMIDKKFVEKITNDFIKELKKIKKETLLIQELKDSRIEIIFKGYSCEECNNEKAWLYPSILNSNKEFIFQCQSCGSCYKITLEKEIKIKNG